MLPPPRRARAHPPREIQRDLCPRSIVSLPQKNPHISDTGFTVGVGDANSHTPPQAFALPGGEHVAESSGFKLQVEGFGSMIRNPLRQFAVLIFGGALRVIGLVCIIVALIIVMAYLVQITPSLLPKIKVVGHATSRKERWEAAAKIVIPIAAVLGTVGGGFLARTGSGQASESDTRPNHGSSASAATVSPTIKFSDPRGTIENPLSASCQYDVVVTGQIPNGYRFAVGNEVVGQNADMVFVPEQAASQVATDTWRVPVVFGAAGDAGKQFQVELVVLPMQQIDYLVAEAQSVRTYTSGSKYAGETWWRASGPPPSPAILQDQEFVQRTADTTGCPAA
jgi:hypothetical protein